MATDMYYLAILQISVTEWREDVIPSISGGGLDGDFVFHRAEIHWGRGKWREIEAKSL